MTQQAVQTKAALNPAGTRPQDWSSSTIPLTWGVRVWHEQDTNPSVGNDCVVDIEVKDQNGNLIPGGQKYHEHENIAVGASRDYQGNDMPPKPTTPGTYRLDIGVFSPRWGEMYYWNLFEYFTV